MCCLCLSLPLTNITHYVVSSVLFVCLFFFVHFCCTLNFFQSVWFNLKISCFEEYWHIYHVMYKNFVKVKTLFSTFGWLVDLQTLFIAILMVCSVICFGQCGSVDKVPHFIVEHVDSDLHWLDCHCAVCLNEVWQHLIW